MNNNKAIFVVFVSLSILFIHLILAMLLTTIDFISEMQVSPRKGQGNHLSQEPYKHIDKIKTLISSQSVTSEQPHLNEDILLLARIIDAEAKGESFEGKIAVGNVVLNRVKDEQFPDTIKEVIFQKGQFQPVLNGTIYNEPSKESIKAAIEAHKTNLVGNAIYFYNPDLISDTWILSRQVIKKIGKHVFAM